MVWLRNDEWGEERLNDVATATAVPSAYVPHSGCGENHFRFLCTLLASRIGMELGPFTIQIL
jgi:hypothetical protein